MEVSGSSDAFVSFPGDLATPQVVAGLNDGKVSSKWENIPWAQPVRHLSC
jgi:hypothetical protein